MTHNMYASMLHPGKFELLLFFAVFILIIHPLIVYFRYRLTIPRLKCITPRGSMALADPVNHAERELRELNFECMGEYQYLTGQHFIILRIYCSPDFLHEAYVIVKPAMVNVSDSIEFYDHYQPRGSLTTDNRKLGGFFTYSPEKIVVRAPGIDAVAELYQLHLAIGEIMHEHGLQSIPTEPDGLEDRIQREKTDDYDYQVEIGQFWKNQNGDYRRTLLSAYKTTYTIWLKMLALPFSAKTGMKDREAILKDVQEQLSKIKIEAPLGPGSEK